MSCVAMAPSMVSLTISGHVPPVPSRATGSCFTGFQPLDSDTSNMSDP